MSSSRVFSPFYLLLSISLLLQLAVALNPIFHECNTTSFTPNGTYNENLNTLLSQLNSTTPLTGSGNGSLGQSPDQVYGLAFCRGDINSTVCQACITSAAIEIQQYCQYKEEAVIWYEYCQLKYSNLDFFGQIDYREAFYYPYFNNVSDPVSFNTSVINLLKLVEGQAIVSPKLFATGTLGVGNSTTIYGLVQCTPDLSSANCETCLDWIIGFVPRLLYGKEGGIIMTGTCELQYHTYPFFTT
ncbi:hypothetical protein Vadar_025587 [Vaccinium darrowii]|uniref:Uncharacterized protein n=1 Tax=Vaccinium darrowii TaxID=229202 RepID=A0ACB7YFR7_9ERIC|nr:hypothetical protein Vadar_025587 [Vaccinium darrowii]